MSFKIKTVNRLKTLGMELAETREAMGWTLEKAARETQTQKSYIHAIETDAWEALPEDPTRSNLIRRYIRALGNDSDLLVLAKPLLATVTPSEAQVFPARTRLNMSPMQIKLIFLGVILAGIMGFLGLQIHALIRPPTLTLIEPADGFTTDVPTLLVTGSTEKDALISINQQLTVKNSDNTFESTVDLKRGVNVITVSARKKYSKPRVIYRTVIFEN